MHMDQMRGLVGKFKPEIFAISTSFSDSFNFELKNNFSDPTVSVGKVLRFSIIGKHGTQTPQSVQMGFCTSITAAHSQNDMELETATTV